MLLSTCTFKKGDGLWLETLKIKPESVCIKTKLFPGIKQIYLYQIISPEQHIVDGKIPIILVKFLSWSLKPSILFKIYYHYFDVHLIHQQRQGWRGTKLQKCVKLKYCQYIYHIINPYTIFLFWLFYLT